MGPTAWRVLRALGVAAVGGVAALAAMGPLGRTEGSVGPGRVELRAAPGWDGGTVIELPPLGRIDADTHDVPAALSARVVALDIDRVQHAVIGPDPVGQLTAELEDDLPGLLRSFALRVGIVSILVGAVAALLLPGRHLAHAPLGAAGGLVAVAGLLAATWAPYDLDAFREPRFEGALERAPGIIDAIERNLGGIDEAVQDRVTVLSARLADLYAAGADELPGSAVDETVILHVSDIHLNPLAVELVGRLSQDFAVDAVLDTGDLTSFGVPFEARIGALIAEIGAPWYFVPGNHDSPGNRRQLAAVANVELLDGAVAEIEDVRVLGVADPTFTASNEVSTAEANAAKQAAAGEVAERVRAERPDLLAVHDVRQASESVGVVPVVVAGHTHERSRETRDGTQVLTVGSTGATGLGSFTVETGQAYEAEILRFRGGELVAVDYLSFEGIGGAFTLDRHLIEPTEEAPFDLLPTPWSG